MLLFLSAAGVFLSILLLFFNAGKFRSSIYLGAFFFLLSLYCLNIYVLYYSQSVFWISLIATHITFLYYLIGPALYLYVRSVLTGDARFQKNDCLHLLPALVFLFASLPYLFTPWEDKLAIARQIVANPQFLMGHKFTVLSEIFSVPFIYISRPLQMFIYFFFSLRMFLRYREGKMNAIDIRQFETVFKWLVVFISFVFVVLLGHTSSLFLTFVQSKVSLFYSFDISLFISVGGLLGLIITPFLFPSILYGLRVVQYQAPLSNEIVINPTEIETEVPKKGSFSLSEELMDEINQKIEACLAHRPYLDPDFNLASLAALTRIQMHHMGYYFREYRKSTFTDFRNELRVKYAIELLSQGENAKLTLDAIGQLSGFSSRNSFFIAFKKVTGVAPSKFQVEKSL